MCIIFKGNINILSYQNAVPQFTKTVNDINKYCVFSAYYGPSSIQTISTLSHLIIITV